MLLRFLPVTMLGIIAAAAGILLAPLSRAFLLIPVLIALFTLLVWALRRLYYRHAELAILEKHVRYTAGWLRRQTYYALYGNVKDNLTIHYPFSSRGTLRIDVAGENVVTSSNGQSLSVRSNGFSVPYLEGIAEKDELLDRLLTFGPKRQALKTEAVRSVKPALANTLVPLTLGLAALLAGLWYVSAILGIVMPGLDSLLLLSGAALSLLILAIAFLSVRARTYRIEPYRIVGASGILYKRQKSVVCAKIDHLNMAEGFLNKLFGNGNVAVHTAGSTLGSAELLVKNIPGHKEFYRQLEEQYS